MAARKIFPARLPKYIYPTTDSHNPIGTPADSQLEFDEADLWNFNEFSASLDASAKFKPLPNSRSSKKSSSSSSKKTEVASMVSASLPLKIPDWSKILKDEYRGGGKRESDEDDDDENDDCISGDGLASRIPPHEYLARRRGASFSVHEGIGRTLKGRDLRRVRNAIWKKTGFED
ncbi:uncharacterized protein LOC110810742 [Carica papaya]|uniref:uncharacterized protein LOC110810742 n=1 Tax=Carica papaya TaxID=3649 RepID=UPI000B8D1B81|nr:uncharacterized protein LOC110810742 [Carica papaya]